MKSEPIKDFLSLENARNKRNAALYVDLLHRAYGCKQDVLIGHHLNFQMHGDITSINEVPSADTLLFDHDVMDKIFGEEAHWIMGHMAMMRSDFDKREDFIRYQLKQMDGRKTV